MPKFDGLLTKKSLMSSHGNHMESSPRGKSAIESCYSPMMPLKFRIYRSLSTNFFRLAGSYQGELRHHLR